MDAKLIKAFYQSLRDDPIKQGSAYYQEELHKRRGQGDAIARMARRIQLSDEAVAQLFSGQRGTGKSTELLRLVDLLEEDCSVFLIDYVEYNNLSMPVEVTDFLLSIMGGFAEKVAEQYGQNFTGESYWERITQFLGSQVNLEGITLRLGNKQGGGDIKLGLVNDPSLKAALQEQMRGHIGAFVKDARTFVSEMVRFIRGKRGENHKVVLIVDSMEKIRGSGDNAQAVYASVENLFNSNADHLIFQDLFTVYTVPPYLQPLAPGWPATTGMIPWSICPTSTFFTRTEALTMPVSRLCVRWSANAVNVGPSFSVRLKWTG